MTRPASKKQMEGIITKTGINVEFAYCRKCMKTKKATEFMVAVDFWIDANGLLSVCKECTNEIYNKYYGNDHSIESAILKTCRTLNIKYEEAAIVATKNHIETFRKKGKETENVFGIYKTKLLAVQKTTVDNRDLNLTFEEPNRHVIQEIEEGALDDQAYFEETWGKGLAIEDYEFLESEFAKWKKTTKCDTQGEEILVRELCHKQNDIRKARFEGKSVDGLVKGLQEIMKNSALTPALQNAASAGRSAECFGVWAKDIETLTPAEWFDKQEKYRDMDGLKEDIEDIKRSTGNFITGSRDFNTSDLEEINDGEDFDIGSEVDGG